MEFTPANYISILSFSLIVMSVIVAVIMGVHYASLKQGIVPRKYMLKISFGLFFWLLFCSIVVQSDLLREQPFPRVPLFFALIIIVTVAFSFSSVGSLLATGLPIWTLVLFQFFRFPLELVLHSWSNQGTIPQTMTWTGENLDIVAGALALVLAPFAAKWKTAAWIANIVGFVLLLNVMRVAILSSPVPFGWNVVPPLQLIFYSPYFLIVPVCVAGALAGHIILTRSLIYQAK